MTDEAIRTEWSRICRMYRRGGSLRQRLALMYADQLEAAGVSEGDIERLFPPQPPSRITYNGE
jgi:hypothetical protein